MNEFSLQFAISPVGISLQPTKGIKSLQYGEIPTSGSLDFHQRALKLVFLVFQLRIRKPTSNSPVQSRSF